MLRHLPSRHAMWDNADTSRKLLQYQKNVEMWDDSFERPFLQKTDWRKSSQWAMIIRRHAEVLDWAVLMHGNVSRQVRGRHRLENCRISAKFVCQLQ